MSFDVSRILGVPVNVLSQSVNTCGCKCLVSFTVLFSVDGGHRGSCFYGSASV